MTRRKRPGRITTADPPEWEPEPLTKSQILGLKRSLRDLRSVTHANVPVPKTRRCRLGGKNLKNADFVGAAETLFQGLDERER